VRPVGVCQAYGFEITAQLKLQKSVLEISVLLLSTSHVLEEFWLSLLE
jgi:hypothetical protein